MKKKIVVLSGGVSEEREISLKSGAAVSAALSANWDVLQIDPQEAGWLEQVIAARADCVFNALHGKVGEDGVIQAELDANQIIYTGAGAEASALCFDKARCKDRLKNSGILLAKSYLWGGELECELPFPVVVKPTSSGSSVGVNIVHEQNDFFAACMGASQYGQVMVEEFIQGVDVCMPIVEGIDLLPIAIKPQSEFYDFHAKYQASSTSYEIGADMSDVEIDACRTLSRHVFKELGCVNWGRVDFMRSIDGRLYFLEINTIPGLTESSLVPKSAAAVNVDFTSLIEKIIANKLEMHLQK